MFSNLFSQIPSLLSCMGGRKVHRSAAPPSVPTLNYVSRWEVNGGPSIAYPSPAYIPTSRYGINLQDPTYNSQRISHITSSTVIDLRSGVLEEDGSITYDQDQNGVVDPNWRGFSALNRVNTANRYGFLTSNLSTPPAAYSQTCSHRGHYDGPTITTASKAPEESTNGANSKNAVKPNLRKSRQSVDRGHSSFKDVGSQRYMRRRDDYSSLPPKSGQSTNLPTIVISYHDTTTSGVPEEPGFGHVMSLVSDGDVNGDYTDGDTDDGTISDGSDRSDDPDVVDSAHGALRRVSKDQYSLESQREAAISAVRQVQAELAGLKKNDYYYPYPKNSIRARHKVLYSNNSLLGPVEEIDDNVAEQMD